MSDKIPDYYKKIRKPLAPPSRIIKSKKDKQKYKFNFDED